MIGFRVLGEKILRAETQQAEITSGSFPGVGRSVGMYESVISRGSV